MGSPQRGDKRNVEQMLVMTHSLQYVSMFYINCYKNDTFE
jgi:hypothetical protein